MAVTRPSPERFRDAHLISTAELAAELEGATPPALLDVRWALTGPPGREEFDRGHIGGAQFVDLDRELAATPGRRGRHPLPGAGAFGAAMRAHGVRASMPVVVYDSGPGTAAARAWWLLRYFGHGNARLLDGGYAAWQRERRPVSTRDEPPPPGDFVAEPGHMPVLDAAGALALAGSGILLDARASERFRGDVEPVDPVAGHIPGARSAPATENVTADGHFRPSGELRSRFTGLGVRAGAPVGAYCGSGVTAAHEVLALALAGVEGAALYAGSWSEWVADPQRPVARGDA